MKQKDMRIIKVGVGGRLEVKIIPNTLEAKQKEVGGSIECPSLGKEFANMGIDLVTYGEAKMFLDEPINLREHASIVFIKKDTGEILDFVAGDCFFCSHDETDFSSITAKQINFLSDKLKAHNDFYIIAL